MLALRAQEIQRNQEVFKPTFGIHALPSPDARRHHGLSMADTMKKKLEATKEFCHLDEMLSAEGSCELTVPTLQVCLGVSLAISTTSHNHNQPFWS